MKRRDFVRSALFTTGTLALTPWASAQAASSDLQFRDGHSFFVDQDGSANMLAHDYESNMFRRTKLFGHGEVLDAENQVIYDRDHLLLSPFNHPKRDSNLLLYCQFNAKEKTLSHYHFLQLNTQDQTADYVSTYRPTGQYGDLTGKEQLLLLLDNTCSDDIATFLYKDTKGTVRVGAFQTTGKQGQFTPLAEMDTEQSQELAGARWCGPYDNLVGKEKNVFFAVLQGVGIRVFQFDGDQLTLLSRIENGRSFGSFVYQYPKLTMENVADDRTNVFEVITPHAPAGVLPSRDVLMLTSDRGVHYLNYNANDGDFELVHENRDFFDTAMIFTTAQVNYMNPNQPDLLIFRDDENHMFATLTYRNGKFVSKLERIPAHIISPRDVFIGFPAKKSGDVTNHGTTQAGLLGAAAVADDAGTAFQYPLTFVSPEKGSSSYYHLNVSDTPDEEGNHGTVDKKDEKDVDNGGGGIVPDPDKIIDDIDDDFDWDPLGKKELIAEVAGLVVGGLIIALSRLIYLRNSQYSDGLGKSLNGSGLSDEESAKAAYAAVFGNDDEQQRKQRETQASRTELDKAHEELQRITTEAQETARRLQESHDAEIQRLKSEITSMATQAQELRKKADAKEEKKGTFDRLTRQKTQLETQVSTLQENMSSLQSSLRLVETQRDNAKKAMGDLAASHKEMMEAAGRRKGNLAEALSKMCDECQQHAGALKEEIKATDTELITETQKTQKLEQTWSEYGWSWITWSK